MAVLIIQPADGKSFRVPLEGATVRIGRSQENEICLADDAAISRFHAEIDHRAGQCIVNDLGSHNGTFVDGQPVSRPTPVDVGARIQVGRTTILLAHEGDTAQIVREPAVADLLDGSSVVLSVADIVGAGTVTTIGEAPGVPSSSQGRAFAALSRWAPELLSEKPQAEVLDLVLDMVFEATAPERGAILLLEGDPARLRVGASRGMSAGDDEDSLVSKTIADLVITKKQSVLTSNAQLDPRFMSAMSIGVQSIQSAMSVPLWNNRDVIGMIYADTVDRPVSFSKVDLEVLTLLANLAAIKIDHGRLFERDQKMRELERELQAAAKIQRGLLPAEPPRIEGYQIYAHNEPCYEVGGDCYDFQLRPNGRLALALGDVSGKGMGAALLMATLQAAFRAHAGTDVDPRGLVERLNRAVYANSDPDKFITFFYGELDPADGSLRYVNAGHNPPLLFRGGGGMEELRTGGTILGFRPGSEYAPKELTLAPGDLLVMFTDGVTEMQDPDGEEFGDDRLAGTLRVGLSDSVDRIGQRVYETVRSFARTAGQFDDLTLALLRRV